MSTLIHRRVEAARKGENPKVIGRMKSGWVVLGDAQFVDGYSLLLPDPVVANLNELKGEARVQYLADVATLGDVLLKVTGAARINYEILGNLEQALHTHLFPRYEDEPEDKRTLPVWFYDWDAAPQFDKALHSEIMAKIKKELEKVVS